MSVTQQQVLDCLARVMSPRGTALTNANVLSAITVTDGKVFFSINVDAAEARAWESARAQAENAVRAIPGVETDEGFEFDLVHDRIMLDTRTPVGKFQGGGFGPTVQLGDGTLVTSYSYRGTDDKTHLEVVRWHLPPAQ